MKTYRVEGSVNVVNANGGITTVRPVHYGEYNTHFEAIKQFKEEHGDAKHVSWNVV